MFSKMSVIGQPTSTPTEYGVIPAALSVEATSLSSSQVSGGSTPASSKSATLYQMVDLFDALEHQPVLGPVDRPDVGDRLAEVVDDRIAEVVDRLDARLARRSPP